jgi:hypothetical protein
LFVHDLQKLERTGMKHALAISFVFWIAADPAAAQASGSGSRAPQKARAGVNAASIYRQAFALMPKLDASQSKLLDGPPESAGEARRTLLASAEPALKLVAEASRASYVDWELDLSQGNNLALPHFGHLRDLSRFARLKAHLSGGKIAVEHHEMMLRMAHHATPPPLIIGRLIQIDIEVRALTSIAQMLPEWDEALRNRLRAGVSGGLPPAATLSQCLLFEAEFTSSWLLKTLDAEVKTKGSSAGTRAWLATLLPGMGSYLADLLKKGEQARSVLPADATEARRMIAEDRAQTLGWGQFAALPHEKLDAAAKSLQPKLEAIAQRNFLIAAMTKIDIKMLRERELKLEKMRSMLLTAFDVQAKGESALPGALATLRRTAGGFELTSKEHFGGKPVVLTVGSP